MQPSRTGLFICLVTLALIQLFSAGLVYQNTRHLRDDAAWVSHTHEVLEALQDSLKTIVDAETGQRGYLLTNNLGYLQPFSSAMGKVRDRVARVKELLKDNPLELDRFRAVEALIDAKLQELNWTVELQKMDPVEAAKVVKSHLGKNLMLSIREGIGAMVKEEHGLLALREGNSRRSYRIATVSGGVIALLGLVMTAGFLVQLLKHLRERSRFEEALNLNRQWLQVTLNSIGDGLIATDRMGNVTTLNPAAGKMTGWAPEEAVGRPMKEVFSIINELTGDPAVNPADRVLNEGISGDLGHNTVLVSREGRSLPIEDSAAPILDGEGRVAGMVLVFHDITDRKEAELEKTLLEARQQEAKNLETLVVLAGGVAHDFNNLLTTIIGNANLGTMAVEPEGKVARFLESIEKAALKAADLTRQLLAYAGKGKYMVTEVDLNAVLQEILAPMAVSGPRPVVVKCNLSRELPLVLGDAAQLTQVLANLLVNAREACGDGPTRAITVHTCSEEVDEAWITAQPWVVPVAPGHYSSVEVADSGDGMSPEILARAFEPFFSTKFAGRGLGLAAVAGILRNHGGGLWVRSASGQGSTFRILLPSLQAPPIRPT